jgi:hypothetical protein
MLVMTPNEALVLHLGLLPLGLGSISYYLPVLVNEESLVTSSVYESRQHQQQSNPKGKEKGKSTVPTEMMISQSQGGLGGVEYDSYNIEAIKRRVNNKDVSSSTGVESDEENDHEDYEEEDEQKEQHLPVRYLEEKDEEETCLEPDMLHGHHYLQSSSNVRPPSFAKALKSTTSAHPPPTKPVSRKSLFLLSSPEDD